MFPDRPPAPVNVSVMHLRAASATVSWDVPEGDIIIGFSISQQVYFGLTLALVYLVLPILQTLLAWNPFFITKI